MNPESCCQPVRCEEDNNRQAEPEPSVLRSRQQQQGWAASSQKLSTAGSGDARLSDV